MPHGYNPPDEGEEWIPIHLIDGGCDLQTAGVGMDAPKGKRECSIDGDGCREMYVLVVPIDTIKKLKK